MKNYNIIFVISFFLLVGLTNAASLQVCITNETLQTNTTLVTTTNGAVSNTTLTENTFCKFGCDSSTNLCKDDQANSNYQVAVILALAALVFIFAYLAVKIGEDHEILQIGFTLFTMFLLFAISSIASRIAKEAAQISISNIIDTISASIMWLLILILGYFLIVFIVRQTRALKKGKSDIEGD